METTYPSYKWTRPESMTLPGGSTREYQYDPLMRVKRIGSRDPEQKVITDYQYDYDGMGNITVKATEHGTYQYDYDALDRLIRAGNPTQRDEAFTYDSVGNRPTSASTTGGWTYNPNNELGGYNGTSFLYDENGNTIQKTEGEEVTRYIYNVEDRLAKVEDKSGHIIAEYDYDPFGRRLRKEVDEKRTCFVYSDEGLVGECDDTGSLTRSYGYVPGSTWTTDPLFMKEDNEYYFYHNDHLGTPQKMTDPSGAVVWSATYSSFGEAHVDPGSTVTNNLRFPGQYFDQETGLHYNWHRFYDPETGRYITADPIGLAGGMNLYLYANANPIMFIDPKGLVCGSGWNDPIVPDNYGKYDFTPSCQGHDNCYATCGRSWMGCNFEFLSDMLTECSKLTWDPLNQVGCLTMAYTYFAAVSSPAGKYAYDQAQKCCP